MPPPFIIDPATVDTGQAVLTREQIYGELMPHRHEFMLLSGACWYDAAALKLVAFADLRATDWWVRGHVPGRPLLPGVLMLEMAAQSSAILAKLASGDRTSFIGFGGVDTCKFRESVTPPSRLYLCCHLTDHRSRRILADTQGIVAGKLAFEAKITGMRM